MRSLRSALALACALVLLGAASAQAGTPYGNTQAVTDVAVDFSTTDSNSNAARWCTITNRASSANTFDISYNAGTTYITRLPIGASITIGSPTANSTTVITTLRFICSTASGTATAEITCGN